MCLDNSHTLAARISSFFYLRHPAHDKFREVTKAPRLLKDSRQLAPSTHTFTLEAFHTVLIVLAPKSVASPDGGLPGEPKK